MPGLKEKRSRLILLRQDLERLVSLLSVIKPELPAYQQTLAESLSAARFDLAGSPADVLDLLKILTCLQTLLPNFEQLVEKDYHEDKNNRIRVTITEEATTELRVLAYCVRHLPDGSIAWSEFLRALLPLMNALDESAFEQIMSAVAPRPVSCRVEDFKRGRERENSRRNSEPAQLENSDEMLEEIDGFDWKV